ECDCLRTTCGGLAVRADVAEHPFMSPSNRPAPRGRGAVSNPPNRYEREHVEAFDDGWDRADEEPHPLETIVTPEVTRSIITRNTSPDVGFDQSINPYKGCEHGCVYCF